MKWLNLMMAALFCFAIAGCDSQEGVVEQTDEAAEAAMEAEYEAEYEQYAEEEN
ncbi:MULTISPECIES: hypothetical protein [Crateriforma]|uniref:Secreted protein n=1 Tax=Crateriforma conspicua TaxID=2527996 RepID=A0A5C6FYU0_9PLAN|nr:MULTISPECIES: hypothetical protein [Crateriforma]QDV63206.1 hypothetical protein Mal65_23480 [Crateriforma conspicua]TWT68024.1 hypothetical protein Pan14r_02620 [Crateriforma conspicua]TWU67494.1 hypothetical protein V7x_30680 [Crateriforma conspicua]